MSKLNAKFEELKKYWQTDEGKAELDLFFEKLDSEDKRRNRWIQWFKGLFESMGDSLIQRLVDKYESNDYRDREYKAGREPQELLYWLIIYYAKLYCKPCRNKKHIIVGYAGEAYYVGSYVFQVIHGQGSVISVKKIK